MHVLTFDIDWAPDFVVQSVLECVLEHDLKATLFATHPSGILDNLPPHLEIAWHPNFLPGSTQGTSEMETLDCFAQWFPDAVGVRSHSMYWHGALAARYQQYGLRYDSSLLLEGVAHIQPYNHCGILRIPVWWNDGFHLFFQRSCNSLPETALHTPGLKVFQFHPIHIYLNAPDSNHWSQVKASVDMRNGFQSVSRSELAPLINPGIGMGTFFHTLCDWLHSQSIPTTTLRELINQEGNL